MFDFYPGLQHDVKCCKNELQVIPLVVLDGSFVAPAVDVPMPFPN